MEYSLTTGELAKDIGISFQVFVKKCLQDRNYISKYINMPYLTNTSLTYTTQTHYHLSPIDENFEQLKKNQLSGSPSTTTREYFRLHTNDGGKQDQRTR